MRTRLGLVALILFGVFVAPSSLVAQTQITTGVIQGTVTDADRRRASGRHGRSPQRRHEPRRTQTTATGRTVRLPAAAARHRTSSRSRCRASPRSCRRTSPLTVGQSVTLPAAMKVAAWPKPSRSSRHRRSSNRRGRPRRRTLERADRREHADPRTQVRGPADAHPRRQHRPGARRRRDHVCRPARHLQQHQPRRRRLQQRVLRRAGRRPAGRGRHHARSRSRNSR